MEDIANVLVNKWKRIIESVYIDDFSKKVESVDIFRMDNYYNGYPEIEYCYKVSFNFELLDLYNLYNSSDLKTTDSLNKWNKKVENLFVDMFGKDDLFIDEYQSHSFKNDKIDYMTNQGYRYIIQFYPSGFISELRDEKLKELGF